MSLKPKLLFVHDSKHEVMDGLWGALNEMEKDFEIWKENLQVQHSMIVEDGWDFILGWGAFGSSVDLELHKPFYAKAKKGLCIAGNINPPKGTDAYDILFYETKWYRPQIDFHPNIVQAFGINTDIFSPPGIPVPVVWDYIGVGALASWKRWERMEDKKGRRLVVGEYQVGNEQESLGIAQNLLRNGVMVSPMVNPYDLANLYSWSRTLYIPADIYGGGERAILEARSCGLQVEIEDDNPKLKELLDCPIPSHVDYAKKLKEGIMSCLT